MKSFPLTIALIGAVLAPAIAQAGDDHRRTRPGYSYYDRPTYGYQYYYQPQQGYWHRHSTSAFKRHHNYYWHGGSQWDRQRWNRGRHYGWDRDDWNSRHWNNRHWNSRYGDWDYGNRHRWRHHDDD